MSDLPEPLTPKRKSLSKKIRFEVFKRDKFTCQYCGEAAPKVVLQCDHITPVAAGGTNEIFNLITSCFDCNSGKRATPLSCDKEISLQVEQLQQLEERRQQLELLMNWRQELQNLDAEILDRVAQSFSIGGYKFSDTGRNRVKKWLTMFRPDEIIEAATRAFDTYGAWETEDRLYGWSWDEAVQKVPGIIRVMRQESERPYLRRLFYIQGILRNRLKSRNLDRVDYLIHLVEAGVDIDEMEIKAKSAHELHDFEGFYDDYLKSIGRPY